MLTRLNTVCMAVRLYCMYSTVLYSNSFDITQVSTRQACPNLLLLPGHPRHLLEWSVTNLTKSKPGLSSSPSSRAQQGTYCTCNVRFLVVLRGHYWQATACFNSLQLSPSWKKFMLDTPQAVTCTLHVLYLKNLSQLWLWLPPTKS